MRDFTLDFYFCIIVVQIVDNSAEAKAGNFLIKLGRTEEETKIFLTLARKGMLTTLQLSRETGINRTRVYRLVDQLKSLGLIEEIIDEHRKLAKAVGPDRLSVMVSEEENKLIALKNLLPAVTAYYENYQSFAQPGTKVLFYRGKEGIKQQVWNTLRTKGELLGYSYRPLNEIIGDFCLKWQDEWVNRNKSMRDIYSDEYLTSRLLTKKDSLLEKTPNIDSRYISSKILNINHQIDIYNEVVSHYNWFEGEIFGVEIYNEKIASMERELFEIVWKQTKKLKFPE